VPIYIIQGCFGGVIGGAYFKNGGVGLVSAEPQFKFCSLCKAPHIILPILVQFVYIKPRFVALK